MAEQPKVNLLYGDRVQIYPPKPCRRTDYEVSPSEKIANKHGALRNVRPGTNIEGLADLASFYKDLADEARDLERAGWTLESMGNSRYRVVPPDDA